MFSKTKRLHATSIPVNRVSLDVDAFTDQHSTSHPVCHIPSISTDDDVHDKPKMQEKRSGLHPDSDENV